MLRPLGQGRLLSRHLDHRALRMPIAARAAPPRGDEELWAALHERLRAFVGRRISNPDAADDVAQDVLLRLHRNMGDLRVQDRLDAFAYRIARNAIIDHYRSRASSKEIPSTPGDLTARMDADGEAGEVGAGGEGRQELARCLEPLIARLPDSYREALTLTDLGDLSQVQAAQTVGLSIPGMKARVQRARTQVHELLTRCCDVALDQSRHITNVQRTGPCACGSERKPHPH